MLELTKLEEKQAIKVTKNECSICNVAYLRTKMWCKNGKRVRTKTDKDSWIMWTEEVKSSKPKRICLMAK
jgi:hypothetical protein